MIGNMTFGRKTGLEPQFQHLISLKTLGCYLGLCTLEMPPSLVMCSFVIHKIVEIVIIRLKLQFVVWNKVTWKMLTPVPSIQQGSTWFNKSLSGTSLAVQWLRLHLLMQGVWVWSLVRKGRFHMSQSQKNKTYNRSKQYCNKILKTLETVHIQKS